MMANDIKKDSKQYIISGEPFALYLNRPKSSSTKQWNESTHAKISTQNQLTVQHDGRLYQGSLAFIVQFYFPLNRGVKPGQYHTGKPASLDLLRFIIDCCNDILFNNEVTLSHIECYKYYDKIPRVEIFIREEK